MVAIVLLGVVLSRFQSLFVTHSRSHLADHHRKYNESRILKSRGARFSKTWTSGQSALLSSEVANGTQVGGIAGGRESVNDGDTGSQL